MMITDDRTIELLITSSLMLKSNNPSMYFRNYNYVLMVGAYLDIKGIEFTVINHSNGIYEITTNTEKFSL